MAQEFIARKGFISLEGAQITGSLSATGNISSTTLTVTSGITGTATSASYVEYSNVANKPALISGSSQVSYTGLSNTPAGIVSSSAQVGGYGVFATTGSNQFNGSQAITGSLTVTGQVVAQTLNVQQVTSSIVYSSGSNIFGNSLSNTQQFTGSVSVTGSLTVNGVMSLNNDGTYGSAYKALGFTGNTNGSHRIFAGTSDDMFFAAATGRGLDFRVSGSANSSLYIAATGTATFSSNVTATNLYSSGNSGIGTSNPQSITNGISLTIGDSATQHQPYLAFRRNSTGGYWAGINWYDQTTRKSFIEENSDFDLRFGTSNTLRLTISSTGAATFSSTIAASGRISTSHSTSGDYAAVFYNTSATGEGVTIRGGSTSSHNAFIVQPYNGATTLFSILATGAATFSSTIGSAGDITITKASAASFIANNTSASGKSFRLVSADDGTFRIQNTGVLDILTLAFGGAATFSSSVTTSGGGFIAQMASTNTEALLINRTSTSFNNIIKFQTNAADRWILGNRNTGDETFRLYNYNVGADVLTVTNGGNVGIGTASPSNKLTVSNAANGTIASFTNTSDADFFINLTSGLTLLSPTTGTLAFGTSSTERMRITSGGYLKASNNGTYFDAASSQHNLVNSLTDNEVLRIFHSSATAPYGSRVRYPNAAPNGSENWFLYCDDSTTVRFQVRSNGGISNFQANDTNLSDERNKKDIAPLESYWDKFKAIEIVKFKYKDQTHDDYNIGVIAQQVESVAPEFVDVDGWGETVEGEEPLKSIYTADLHHATIKVLQEAMAKIESLEAILQRNNIS